LLFGRSNITANQNAGNPHLIGYRQKKNWRVLRRQRGENATRTTIVSWGYSMEKSGKKLKGAQRGLQKPILVALANPELQPRQINDGGSCLHR
jgi:hypothetical protein